MPTSVTSVYPASGPTAGGATVDIYGSGFLNASAVSFGGTNAWEVAVDSDAHITAQEPAHAAGVVDVIVTAPSGTSQATSADHYTFGSGLSTTTTLTSSANPSAYGQSVTLTATVANGGHGAPTGTVTFQDGGATLGQGTLTNGTATLPISSLIAGVHHITASYSGDSGDNGSTSSVYTQTVQVASTTTALSTNVNPSAPGQPVTLTAVVSNGGSPAPTGTVTFKDGSNVLGYGTLSNGVATLAASFTTFGGHNLTAVYNGDANDYGSTSSVWTQTVQPAATTTTVTSNLDPSHPWDSVTFSAYVSAGYGTPTGGVSFYDGSSVIGTGTLSGGYASFTVSSLTLGNHSIAAVYGGDANDYGSTSPVWTQYVQLISTTTGLVSSLNPAQPGQGVTLTATVSTGGNGTATGGVAFYDGSSVIGTGTLSNGQATFATSSLSLGSHNLAAVYGGDARDYGSTSPMLTQRVQLVTTTGLTSSENPATATDAVTFTAVVNNGGVETPTGVITFKDGSAVLGTGTLSNGQATFTTSTLTVGGHTITAVYGGDADDQASTSGQVSESVLAIPTTTALSSGLNPAQPGQSVTLTATVAAGAYPTPTGTVTFEDGSSYLGTGTLSAGGQATFTTTSLSLGAHTLTAVYGGSANDAGSTSAALTQEVQRVTTVSLDSGANPSTFGQAVTLYASVGNGVQGGPSGTVTFEDGTTVIGTGTLSNGMTYLSTSSLAVGSHPLTAVYAGDAYDQAGTSAVLNQTVQPDPTTTYLYSGQNPSTVGQSVTFTAVVTTGGNGAATPTGLVLFEQNGAVLGAGVLNQQSGADTATFTTAGLAVGSDAVTAVYQGDADCDRQPGVAHPAGAAAGRLDARGPDPRRRPATGLPAAAGRGERGPERRRPAPGPVARPGPERRRPRPTSLRPGLQLRRRRPVARRRGHADHRPVRRRAHVARRHADGGRRGAGTGDVLHGGARRRGCVPRGAAGTGLRHGATLLVAESDGEPLRPWPGDPDGERHNRGGGRDGLRLRGRLGSGGAGPARPHCRRRPLGDGGRRRADVHGQRRRHVHRPGRRPGSAGAKTATAVTPTRPRAARGSSSTPPAWRRP